MRVCYFGTYRANYARNQIMMEGLRCNGVDVVECHESLWHGVEDRVQTASGGWTHPKFWWRVAQTYAKLLWKYRQVDEYDVMVVGYPGQMDVFLGRVLTWLKRKPLVWDVFMSVYLIALERNLDTKSRFTLQLLRQLERSALRLPNMLIQDTVQYVNWFHDVHGVDTQRFRLVPTGADDRVFRSLPSEACDDGIFRVIYYGTFIPNHGVEHIIEAARLLADETGIRFEMVGSGPEQARARSLAEEHGLHNVTFIEWLEKPELIQRVSQADVCLGAFGTTPQSLMTVQNKIYEGLAMAKPVITGDSPAMRQTLEHGEHVYLCERADGGALAKAIRTLRDDPGLRERLAEKGCRIFKEQFDLRHNGERYAGYLRELISK